MQKSEIATGKDRAGDEFFCLRKIRHAVEYFTLCPLERGADSADGCENVDRMHQYESLSWNALKSKQDMWSIKNHCIKITFSPADSYWVITTNRTNNSPTVEARITRNTNTLILQRIYKTGNARTNIVILDTHKNLWFKCCYKRLKLKCKIDA